MLRAESRKTIFFFETEAVDREGYLIRHPPTLKFTDAELGMGEIFLHSIGLNRDSKFVCLNVRDDSFLSKTKPIGWHENRDWSYHNYRDSDIKTYVAAAEALANMTNAPARPDDACSFITSPFVSLIFTLNT